MDLNRNQIEQIRTLTGLKIKGAKRRIAMNNKTETTCGHNKFFSDSKIDLTVVLCVSKNRISWYT